MVDCSKNNPRVVHPPGLNGPGFGGDDDAAGPVGGTAVGRRGMPPGGAAGCSSDSAAGRGQNLQGSFSAVSKPNFASKYYICV